jgi:hypothetical protein
MRELFMHAIYSANVIIITFALYQRVEFAKWGRDSPGVAELELRSREEERKLTPVEKSFSRQS